MSQLHPEVYHLIDAALSEDETFNDPTTGLLIPSDIVGVGMLRAKAVGVLAGLDVAGAVFHRVDPDLAFAPLLADGDALNPGDDIAQVQGSAAAILRAERIALNFLQRMSGIASDTHRYVRAIAGCRARIVDTRKTAPGHRYLDKYAVRMGGGHNHRLNLADGILIKDNHLEALAARGNGLERRGATGPGQGLPHHQGGSRGRVPGRRAGSPGSRRPHNHGWTIWPCRPCRKPWTSSATARW